MCAVKTKKKVLEVWVDFSLSSKLNFFKVFFDTDLPKKNSLLTPGPKAMSLSTHSKVKHMVKVKFM